MAYKDSEDRRAYARAYYERNKKKAKARARDARKRARRRNHEFILRYLKEHPCVDCGEDDPVVLEFDHVKGEKEASVTFLGNQCRPIKTIKAEIAKCEVRCANCHRRKTVAAVNGFRATSSSIDLRSTK